MCYPRMCLEGLENTMITSRQLVSKSVPHESETGMLTTLLFGDNETPRPSLHELWMLHDTWATFCACARQSQVILGWLCIAITRYQIHACTSERIKRWLKLLSNVFMFLATSLDSSFGKVTRLPVSRVR